MRYLRAITTRLPEFTTTLYTTYKDKDNSSKNKPIAMARVSKPLEQTFTRVSVSDSLSDSDRRDNQLLELYSGRVPVQRGTASHVFDGRKIYEGGRSDTAPFHESGLIVDKKAREEGLLRPAEQDEQLQLFGHAPEQRAYVETLVSRDTPQAKMGAMTMLGMADLEERKQSGQSLRPSYDLSDYSMRVVRRLNKSGAIDDADVPHDTSNAFDFSDANRILDSLPSLENLTGEHVDISHQSADAKAHLKSILRSKRSAPTPSHPSHLSEQLRLFED